MYNDSAFLTLACTLAHTRRLYKRTKRHALRPHYADELILLPTYQEDQKSRGGYTFHTIATRSSLLVKTL